MKQHVFKSPKNFIAKLLNGTAQGIVISLMPNAILGGIVAAFFAHSAAGQMVSDVLTMYQFIAPLIIGALVAVQFRFSGLETAIVAGAAFIGSGHVNRQVIHAGADIVFSGYEIAGIGDITNTILTVALAVLLVKTVGRSFGSLAIIAGPIFIGTGAGLAGRITLPYVSMITKAIGHTINHFTTLQPLLMCMLIAISFAILILSPLSTVGISVAIGLNGMAAGAAAMGVAATTVVLVVHSWKVNKLGVTLSVALGGMKMFMPNLFKYPIVLLPAVFTALMSAIPVAIFHISGTPASAGFGLIGFVGPLAALEAGLHPLILMLSWFVFPILTVFFALFLFEKVLKLYKKEIVFAHPVKE